MADSNRAGEPSYVGGAMVFAQESIKMFFEHHGEKTLAEGAEKKGTLVRMPKGTSLHVSEIIANPLPVWNRYLPAPSAL